MGNSVYSFLKNINKNLLVFLIIGLYAFVLLISGFSYHLNYPFLFNNSILLALLILMAFIIGSAKKMGYSLKEVYVSVLMLIAVCTGVGIINKFIYDSSWDGQTYHLQATLALFKGWNPFMEEVNSASRHALWNNHYPKGLEIFGAACMKILPDFELFKSSNLLVFAAALVYLNGFLKKKQWLPAKWRWVANLLLVGNPVATTQLFTGMADGQLYYLLGIATLAMLQWDYNFLNQLIFYACLVILAGLKFTGLLYAGLIVVLVALFLIWKKKNLLLFSIGSSITLFLAVFVIHFNPYITNIKKKGNVFYPLAGSGAINIMIGQNMPASFKNYSRIKKFFLANAASSSNIHGEAVAPDPKVKIPFSIKLKEFTVFKSPSVLYGSFGPLFWGVFLIGIGLWLLVIYYDRGLITPDYLYLMTALIFSIFVIPECWLGRYVPQVWLLPPLLLWPVYRSKIIPRLAIKLSQVAYLLLLGNLTIILLTSFFANIIITNEIDNELRWLKKQKNPVMVQNTDFASTEERLKKRGIPFTTIHESNNPGNKLKIQLLATTSILFIEHPIQAYQPSFFFNYLEKYVRKQK